MLMEFKGYMEDDNKSEKCNLEEYVSKLCKYIDELAKISTKVDYPTEYEKGYNDAAVAIKNTANTLLHKFSN